MFESLDQAQSRIVFCLEFVTYMTTVSSAMTSNVISLYIGATVLYHTVCTSMSQLHFLWPLCTIFGQVYLILAGAEIIQCDVSVDFGVPGTLS